MVLPGLISFTPPPFPLPRPIRSSIIGNVASEVVLTYPPLNITRADLELLEPGGLLNDVVVEFGLRHSLQSLAGELPHVVDDTWIFSSYFYSKLRRNGFGQQAFNAVRKWTAKVDIFAKRTLIVPVNEGNHWFLAVIYRPERCFSEGSNPLLHPEHCYILIMDSLGGLHTAIVDVLRSWLSFEALDKKGRPLDHSPEALHVNVPYQPNGFDCGVYLIYFAERFLEMSEAIIGLALANNGAEIVIFNIRKLLKRRSMLRRTLMRLAAGE